MIYSEGDLFTSIQNLESNTVYIPHVCNSEGAWGAGFVVPLGNHYPKAKEEYLKWAKQSEVSEDTTRNWLTREFPVFGLGHTQFVVVTKNVVVCNMVAQTLGGKRPLRYDALVYCMLTVAKYSQQSEKSTIECPLFGAGLAGGHWPFIHELIRDCWVSRGLSVRIHYLPDKSPPGFIEWLSGVGKLEL